MVLDDSVMRRSDALHEMMGLARAIVADGVVSDAEAKAFQAWIDSHPDVIGIQSVDEIVGILTNVFSDGQISDGERAQLAEILEGFSG